jgi:hypothetical protein
LDGGLNAVFSLNQFRGREREREREREHDTTASVHIRFVDLCAFRVTNLERKHVNLE